MGQTAKVTRVNRPIPVDFHDETTYFALLGTTTAFVECVLAFLLALGFPLLHKASCSAGGSLTRHSHYARVRLGGLTIWRVQCTACKAVFTVLPHFVLRYHQMRPDVARDALLATHGGLSLGNCSTWFEQRADRRKGLLDGLICGQALAFAGIDNRAHRRKQVASPVGPKAIGDLPKDCTHANGLLAGVVGGWDRSVFQEQEEIVLDRGVAFLQALALRGLRLEGQAPRQPSSELPSILRERGLGQPVTAFVHGTVPQEQSL